MQKITLLGNLGKDPEERTTKTGVKIVGFSLAVSSSKDQTVWYSCQIWERKINLFERMMPYLKKGSRVIVCGTFKAPETYESKGGSTKIRLQMEPDFIQFVGLPKRVESEIPKLDPIHPNNSPILDSFTSNKDIPF